MKIHIDGIIFSLQVNGGISVVFRELIARLLGSGISCTVTLESPVRQLLGMTANASIQVLSRPSRTLERFRSCRPVEPCEAGTILHSSYYRLPATKDVASVVTVHDFAYERTVAGPRRWLHSAQKYAAIRRANALVCISEATRDDLLEYVGVLPHQQLHVIYNGVAEVFSPLVIARETFAESSLLLFVGQRGGYKNFHLAVRALAELPGLELICVGGGPLRSEELAGVPPSVARRVRHRGDVDDAELNRLYNQAICLVYPSSYEGFGIPPVEAMRAGCPVVCVPCKAIQEVGGDALVVAAANGPSIAAAVTSICNPSTRLRVRAAGFLQAQRFSWDLHFQQMLRVYRSLS